jgi:hypothetical protein
LVPFFLLSFSPLLLNQAWGNNPELSALIASGEFAPALEIAACIHEPKKRNHALAEIAAKQAGGDARRGALATMRGINDQRLRAETAAFLAGQPRAYGASGGGVIADFDTLIELVTSTIAPDSWLDNGGKGTISGFPTGVLVNTSGVLEQLQPVATPALAQLRQRAQFRGGAENPRRSSRLRKVSLPALERALQERYAAGKSPTETMRVLAGLTRIQYLFVYPDTGDIVIAGPAGDWLLGDDGRTVAVESSAPVLQLDDLLVTLRNARASGRFGCAITPLRENLERTQQFLATTGAKPLAPGKPARDRWLSSLRDSLGFQEIEVHGVPADSRAARVIVEADHHMKRIGMGLEPGVAGVESYLASIELAPGEPAPNLGVLRWWFTLGEGAIRTTPESDAYALTGNSVQVLSENERLTASGERIHTGTSDERNQQFAANFTRHFEALAAKYRVYAELRNVFDWAVVAALLEQGGVREKCGWEARYLLAAQACPIQTFPVPRQVRSVANYRLIGARTLVAGVSGGVEVHAQSKITGRRVLRDDYGALAAERQQATAQRDDERWWWD